MAERVLVAHGRHAGRIRGEESLQAVATCYRWTSGVFVNVRKAADGGRRWLTSAGCGPRAEVVGGLGWRIVLRPKPVPDRLDADFLASVNFALTVF
jgi:hypothetical protein